MKQTKFKDDLSMGLEKTHYLLSRFPLIRKKRKERKGAKSSKHEDYLSMG